MKPQKHSWHQNTKIRPKVKSGIYLMALLKLPRPPGSTVRLKALFVNWKKQYPQLFYEQAWQFHHHWDGLYW